jgi:hypothetical protein
MPRLNNKDYTVEELERLLFIINNIIEKRLLLTTHSVPSNIFNIEELKELVKGSEFTNFGEGERIPSPIPWNFKFEMMINPETQEMADIILNAMRSSEVNENIKKRFNAIIREEVNWYIDRVKYFTVKGDTNVLE